MDDISAAIRSVLNDPQSMAQIQNIMQSLGANDVGRILRTFKIKKNVEVTDNGKIII